MHRSISHGLPQGTRRDGAQLSVRELPEEPCKAWWKGARHGDRDARAIGVVKFQRSRVQEQAIEAVLRLQPFVCFGPAVVAVAHDRVP